jgi:hypothetical protein
MRRRSPGVPGLRRTPSNATEPAEEGVGAQFSLPQIVRVGCACICLRFENSTPGLTRIALVSIVCMWCDCVRSLSHKPGNGEKVANEMSGMYRHPIPSRP